MGEAGRNGDGLRHITGEFQCSFFWAIVAMRIRRVHQSTVAANGSVWRSSPPRAVFGSILETFAPP